MFTYFQGGCNEDIFGVCDGDGTIQGAIDNAEDGEFIFVPQGTYHESIVIDKSIDLVCIEEFGCELDVSGLDFGIQVDADDAIIGSFEIIGDDATRIGIWVRPEAQNTQLFSNTIHGMGAPYSDEDPFSYGILAYGASSE
jgi:nitrous oxidase accessory protein NosD